MSQFDKGYVVGVIVANIIWGVMFLIRYLRGVV